MSRRLRPAVIKCIDCCNSFETYSNRVDNIIRCPECRILRAKKLHIDRHKRYRMSTFGQQQNRKRHLMYTFGLTLEDYDKMWEEQDGVCAICKDINQSGYRLAVDHNHETGEIRGLLCQKCNSALERFELYSKEMDEYLKKEIRHVIPNRCH